MSIWRAAAWSLLISLLLTGATKRKLEGFPQEIWNSLSNNELFKKVWTARNVYRFELIVTFIKRKSNGNPVYFTYRTADDGRYFYPASSVKLPTAIANLKHFSLAEMESEIQFNPALICGGAYPTRTLREHMRMMLMYSDNPAYNVLIDAVGFEAINETLHELGMKQSRITRRLLWCTGEQLKQHPAIKLHPTDAKFRKPANAGELNYPANFKDSIVGRAHVGAGGIAMTGLNFGAHNYLKLSNLHELITDITTGNKVRRMLGNAKWQRLVHLIAAIPEEAGDAGTPVDITKRLYFGQGNPQKDFKRIRSFNIIGEAYGFMTESAYLIDTETGAEVVISARGHFNRNQVIGDDLYEYATEGYPLFRFLGEYFLEEAQKYSSSRWKTKHLPGFLSERLSKGFSRN